jgi:uncharacterized membrane protein HdeD (DUF308 family)
MSAGLARNWWMIGLRGVAAVAFGLLVLALPSSTMASLVLLFAAYVVADGIVAIFAGARAAHEVERWWTLMLEGTINLTVAGAVLVWLALAVVPLVPFAGAWALVTGALMLAAGHRLSSSHGRWLLAFGGGVSAGWGALAAVVAPSAADLGTAALWLMAYALLFGVTLLLLAWRLRARTAEQSAGGAAG